MSLEAYPEDMVVVPIVPHPLHVSYSEYIAQNLGLSYELGDVVDLRDMSGGEFNPQFFPTNRDEDRPVSCKGKTVYLVVPQGPGVKPEELFGRISFMTDAAKEDGAKEVVLVEPDLPYSRQDRGPNEDPETINLIGTGRSALVQARTLHTAGIYRGLTMDVHNPRVVKIWDDTWGVEEGDHALHNISLSFLASYYFRHFSSLYKKVGDRKPVREEDIVFVACDSGARHNTEETMKYMGLEGAPILQLTKGRRVANKPDAVEIKEHKLIGTDSLEGKTLIVREDILDTTGTLGRSMDWIFITHEELAHEYGKPKEFYFFAPHAIFGAFGAEYISQMQGRQKKAASRFQDRAVEMVVTDSRPYVADTMHENKFKRTLTTLRTARIVIDAIRTFHAGESIEDRYSFGSPDEIDKFMEELYSDPLNHPSKLLKRSASHFMVE
ncbi:MAG: ribose-phosphate pyrophosphokinase-like domain-containing protein [archaeon]